MIKAKIKSLLLPHHERRRTIRTNVLLLPGTTAVNIYDHQCMRVRKTFVHIHNEPLVSSSFAAKMYSDDSFHSS